MNRQDMCELNQVSAGIGCKGSPIQPKVPPIDKRNFFIKKKAVGDDCFSLKRNGLGCYATQQLFYSADVVP